MSERGLVVDDVVVTYRDDDGRAATAVDGVALHVAPGEVLALLGPSGSGKSTLLRAVAGLEPLARGAVRWDGTDLAGVPVHRRGFGLMFQDGQLFPHRDVARNVAYGLEMRGLARAERDARVAELLDVVGLGGFGGRAVSTLSGGERQRVALARALAPRPRLLLLDEPLSALDRALRERLASEIRAVLTATGTTAVFVTHDHDEAFAVADRIGVLDAGRLLQVAPPAELWHRPASRRVAEFLGYEAFVEPGHPLHARLGGVGDGVLAVGPGSLRRVTPADATGGDAGDPLGGDLVEGTVRAAGLRRGLVEVVVDVPGLGEVTVLEPSALAEATGALPRPGDVLPLRADRRAVAVVADGGSRA